MNGIKTQLAFIQILFGHLALKIGHGNMGEPPPIFFRLTASFFWHIGRLRRGLRGRTRFGGLPKGTGTLLSPTETSWDFGSEIKRKEKKKMRKKESIVKLSYKKKKKEKYI